MNKNVCFSLDSQGINAHFLMSLTITTIINQINLVSTYSTDLFMCI